MQTFFTDVLVVGAGPTGLTAAAFLAQAGISTIALSRYSGTAPQPRASFFNQRALEIFRDLGIEKEVQDVAMPGITMGHNVMATSFTGQEIMRTQTYGVGDRLTDFYLASPCQYYNCPQHILEPVLLRAASGRGADVRFMHELQALEQTSEEVIARIQNRNTGEEYQVRAKYVIGADGARSGVAEKMEIPFEGQAGLMHMVNSWLEVDLTEYAAYRPAGIYIILQPGGASWVGSGSFVPVRKWNDWMLIQEYDPKGGEPEFSEEAVIKTARTLIGDPNIPVRVKGIYKWQVNNMVAKEYQRGRVFIAGDAAHRHSPAGGLGAVTCIQDAYNLAWKLAFVLKGKAGASLLESYNQERQPVGQQIVDRAMLNLRNKSAMGEVLGLKWGQSTEEGMASLKSLFSDEPEAAERRKALEAVRTLQLARSNALGVALGQRYTSCAVVSDGTPFPEPTRDPEVYYHPTTHPGAYLPHAWVELDRKSVSTLDAAGNGKFCLIVGIGGEPWVKAAAAVSLELGVELPVVAIGYKCEYDDVLGHWSRVREIDDRGALLVRPDRYIAWRSFTRPSSPREALRDALRQALNLQSK